MQLGEERVTFVSEGLELEAVVTGPADAAGLPAAVVCHPHPLYGGTMDNMVVRGICKSLADRGAVALRFNFRGVGGSEGMHTGGEGEVEDALAALKFLRERTGSGGKVALAGYSFGAMMALMAAVRDGAVPHLACVALPVAYYDVDEMEIRGLEVLLVGGDRDDVAPLDGLRKFADTHGGCRLEVVANSDHFFGGRTATVGDMVADFLTR